MSNNKSIEHKGRIESIDGNKINVSFIAMAGCASCQLKGVCSTSDLQEKSVEVYDYSNKFNVGETVNVVLKQTLGFRALFLGYVLPFLIVLLTLILLTVSTNNEAISGLGALIILVPYYLTLYLSRNKIKKDFAFKIFKI